jgi:hypothetical protein
MPKTYPLTSDPKPGSDTGSGRTASGAPIEFADDGQFRHDAYWNSFQFDPPLTHEDALVLLSLDPPTFLGVRGSAVLSG